MSLHCPHCGRYRSKPLFFIMEGDTIHVICHFCVERIYGNDVAVERGGWEKQLSGDTWLVKTRR